MLKDTIELSIHMTSDEIGFKKHLLDQEINTVVRTNTENHVYGITFIDNNSKTVWNASRIGKEFSANAFNDWWNNSKKPEIKIRAEEKSTVLPTSQDLSNEEKPHILFGFLDNNKIGYISQETNIIEALGGLLPENNGNNFEELLFENQIRKKKRTQKTRN